MLEDGLQKPLDAFRLYRPSDWSRPKSTPAKPVLYRQPTRKRGLDLFKFIQSGISGARRAGAGGHDVGTPPVNATVGTRAQVLTAMRRDATVQTTQLHFDQSATEFSGAVGRFQRSSPSICLVSAGDRMRSSGPTRTWFGSQRVSSVRIVSSLPTAVLIDVRFAPTRDQQTQIDMLAAALHEAEIGNLLAFENDLGELVIEAGPPARTLTLISKPTRTLAIYRTSTNEDFEIHTAKFETPPPRTEILKVAHEYAKTWRNPKT
jgi:hypothetical protein